MGVTTDRNDGVLTVTIDRPEVRNAVDRQTADDLERAFRGFDADDDLSVAVLTGAGGTFCAGADLHAVAAGGDDRNRLEPGDRGPMGPTRLLLDKPVVAAVEGHAVAGGLELALWCDLRVAAEDAVFGVFCRRWGVPLVDGGTVRLPRTVGISHALDMILTGRAVAGPEALRMGLANRLTGPGGALDAAQELAARLAAFPQRCLRSDRRSALTSFGRTLQDALASEHDLGMATIASGETVEGASRFAEGEGRHGVFPETRP